VPGPGLLVLVAEAGQVPHRLLRLWRLRAVAYSDPEYEASLAARALGPHDLGRRGTGRYAEAGSARISIRPPSSPSAVRARLTVRAAAGEHR
jgi:hypothetical protein